jgi:hypothetical protein
MEVVCTSPFVRLFSEITDVNSKKFYTGGLYHWPQILYSEAPFF